MKVTEKFWITTDRGCIGIICGEDEITGERKAYIGIGNGQNENWDAEYIAQQGSPLSLGMVEQIRGRLTKPEDENEVCLCGHKRKDHPEKMLGVCRVCGCSKFKKKK